MFQPFPLDWYAGNLEENGLHACSMEHSATRGRKREAEYNGEYFGGFSPCSTSAVMAGSWLVPEKRVKTYMDD
jgi:hypothetical protein